MKAIAALFVLAACTHNRPFSAVNEVDGRVIVRTIDGHEQHATVVSTPAGKVLQSDSGATIDFGNVVKLTDQRSLRGALEGTGIGFGIGFGIGAIIGIADGDDPPCEDRHGYCIDFTAGEKAVLGGSSSASSAVASASSPARSAAASSSTKAARLPWSARPALPAPSSASPSTSDATSCHGAEFPSAASYSQEDVSMPDRHRHMDSTLAVLDTCVRAGDHDGAMEQFIAFDADLARYARGEEQLLFPVIDRFSSVPPRATEHMRREHRSLRRLVDTLGSLLARDDAPRALDVLGTLRSVLLLHLEKEAWVIGPVMR